MEFLLLNRNLDQRYLIDTYESALWNERYDTAGDFEIYTPATIDVLSQFVKSYYIKKSDSDTIGIIEKMEITTDVEEGNYLLISGRCAKSLLDRRIIWRQTNIEGNTEESIRRILTENIISPSIHERKMDFFTLNEERTIKNEDEFELQLFGESVLKAIENICIVFGYGFKVILQNKQLVFELYKGINRSISQSENPRVIFSADYDNLIMSNYKNDQTETKNVALVGGEGEGIVRKTAVVGEGVGIERREIFVDAKEISTNEGEIGILDYNILLSQKGIESLSPLTAFLEFETEIALTNQYQYKIDFNLGDIVTIRNEYGIEQDCRIIEMLESDSREGYRMIPTLKGVT